MPLQTQTHVIEPTGVQYDSRNPAGDTGFDITVGPGQQYATITEALAVVTDNQTIGIYGDGTAATYYLNDPVDLSGRGRAPGFRFNLEVFGPGRAEFSATNIDTSPSLPSQERSKGWAVVGSSENPTVEATFSGNGLIRDMRGVENGDPGNFWSGIRGQGDCQITCRWSTDNCDNGIQATHKGFDLRDSSHRRNGRDGLTHAVYLDSANNGPAYIANNVFGQTGILYSVASTSIQCRGRDTTIENNILERGKEARQVNKLQGGAFTFRNNSLVEDDAVETNTSAIVRYDDDGDPAFPPISCVVTGNAFSRINGPAGTALANDSSIAATQSGNTFDGFIQETSGDWSGGDLAANEWTEVSAGETAQDLGVREGYTSYPLNSSMGSQFSPWCTMVYKPETRLFYNPCGGGHTNGSLNAVFAVNIDTGLYEEVVAPTALATVQSLPAGDKYDPYPNDGTQAKPGSRHNYGQAVYVPYPGATHPLIGVDGGIFFVGGALYETGGFNGKTWFLDFASGLYTELQESPRGGGFGSAAICYEPGANGGKIWCACSNFFVDQFDLNTLSWTTGGTQYPQPPGFYYTQEYDSTTGLILNIGSSDVRVIDPSDGSMDLGVATSGDALPTSRRGSVMPGRVGGEMMYFDAEVDKDFFAIDLTAYPAALPVTRIPLGGIDPTTPTWVYTGEDRQGIFGRCRHFGNGIYGFLGRHDRKLLKVRIP